MLCAGGCCSCNGNDWDEKVNCTLVLAGNYGRKVSVLLSIGRKQDSAMRFRQQMWMVRYDVGTKRLGG